MNGRVVPFGALLLLMAPLLACASTDRATDAAQRGRDAAQPLSPVSAALLLEAWSHKSADFEEPRQPGTQQLYEMYLETFVRYGNDAELPQLRVFEHDEAEYPRFTYAEQQILMSSYLLRSRSLRQLAVETLERAESLREEGRDEEAERHIRAVERWAEANLEEGIVEIARLIGEALLEAAERRR